MISAPWTDEQVLALNTFQVSGLMHPFTCGYREDHYVVDTGTLVATHLGFVCPYRPCEYTQDWAHEWMADPDFLTRYRERLKGLFNG